MAVKLCLGTVQFGMKYGINNTLGQPSLEESVDIIDTAVQNGIHVIDTARAYGTAEIVLGEYLSVKKPPSDIKIISKLRPNIIEQNDKDVTGVVKREFYDTLRRLHVDHLDGYLLHTPEYIYNNEILTALCKLKDEKSVDHIGVSIYELREGFEAIKSGIVDYIQLPYSILDQRGARDDFFKQAKESGISIYTRSAFLQGLFMMEEEHIPEWLSSARPYIKQFNKLLEKYQVDKVSALLQFVKQEPYIDYLVFGVDTKEQLLEDIRKFNASEIPEEFINELRTSFSSIDKSIIFPSLWSNGKKAE